MNFKQKDIKAAYSKVKGVADLPNYLQDLLKMGVHKYDTFVADGRSVYFGADNYQIQSKPKYAVMNVANICDKDRFKHYLKNHQRGKTDFPAFCKDSAETGVEKWTLDLNQMTCTYFDKSNTIIWEEQISK
jgi:uncharacterized protein YbcV (DUF1398 family)